MKKIVVFAATLALAAGVMFGCSSNSSDTAATEDAATESTAADAALVVDEAAKTVTIQATATGNAGPSIHFLANEGGGNADKAYFTTTATPQELYDALETLGAEHGDNIAVEDTEGTIEGSDLDLIVEVDGKQFTPIDLLESTDPRPTKARFGGNIDANTEYGTGCMFCMESCSLGITSDSSYEYQEPVEFTAGADMPAAGTAVTVVYTLK